MAKKRKKAAKKSRRVKAKSAPKRRRRTSPTPKPKRRRRTKKASAVSTPKRRRRKGMKRRHHRKTRKSSRGSRGVSYNSVSKIVTQGAIIGAGGWAVLALTDKLAQVFNIKSENKTLIRSAGILGALFLLPKFLPKQRHIVEQASLGATILLGVTFLDKITGTGILSGEATDEDVIARQLAHQLDVAGYLPESIDGVMEGVMEGYSMEESGLLGEDDDFGVMEGEEGMW